eukprot:TRINITY_DN8849_c0_g1_i4.p1 TRINITY_DN8849_c0_g1~~TRINITY_DN8849_c0_g1_i4.p1  ORF type:complete len:573 (+),score=78.19 TRINITY_DN8849_c0_g1_i4:288-2006(+)
MLTGRRPSISMATPQNPLTMQHVVLDLDQKTPDEYIKGAARIPGEQRFFVSPNEHQQDSWFSLSTRGCVHQASACLCVKDEVSGSAWSLTPVRKTAIRKMGKAVLKQGHVEATSLSTEVIESATWMHKEAGKVTFDHRSAVVELARHLNVLLACPDLHDFNPLLAFIELSPINPDHFESATFDNHQRLTLKEGHCFLRNRNSRMMTFRRIVVFLICGGLACAMFFAIFWPLHFTYCSDACSWLVITVTAGFCLAVFLLLTNVPRLMPRTFRRTPAPREFRIWLRLFEDHVAFFYKHIHVVDGLPAEDVLFLLPGFKLSFPQRGLLSCIWNCDLLCRSYECRLESIDGVWDLAFRTSAAMEQWADAIDKAMADRGLLRDQCRYELDERVPRIEDMTLSSQSDLNAQLDLRLFLSSVVPACQSEDVYEMGSFAPVHPDCQASWFQDGLEYFASCKAAIESAQTEILITDWILSPEVMLARPSPGQLAAEARALDPKNSLEDQALTLVRLLLERAEAGWRSECFFLPSSRFLCRTTAVTPPRCCCSTPTSVCSGTLREPSRSGHTTRSSAWWTKP